MELSPSTARPDRPESRLVRFSLRFLLLATTIIAIAFGVMAYQIELARRDRIAVLKIEELGGRPLRITRREGRSYSDGKLPEPRFKWIHQLLGEDYFTYVPAIDVRDPAITADTLRAMIPFLQQIRLVKGINEDGKTNVALIDVGNPNVDTKLIEEFKSRVPQCVFSSTLVGCMGTNTAD